MKKMLSLYTIFAVVFVLMFTACGNDIPAVTDVKSTELQLQGVKNGDTIATIKTSLGDIKVVLYPELAPLAVENFITLSQEGYYDNIIFHRVIEDFVVQSGDPTGQGSGGESIWELPFSDEFSDKLHHYTGALSMANSGANSNKSQFFIVTQAPKSLTADVVTLMQDASWREGIINAYSQSGGTPNLDYKHTVFGHVYEGLDIAFKISRAKTNEKDKPKEDIVIHTIEISTAEIEASAPSDSTLDSQENASDVQDSEPASEAQDSEPAE